MNFACGGITTIFGQSFGKFEGMYTRRVYFLSLEHVTLTSTRVSPDGFIQETLLPKYFSNICFSYVSRLFCEDVRPMIESRNAEAKIKAAEERAPNCCFSPGGPITLTRKTYIGLSIYPHFPRKSWSQETPG